MFTHTNTMTSINKTLMPEARLSPPFIACSAALSASTRARVLRCVRRHIVYGNTTF